MARIDGFPDYTVANFGKVRPFRFWCQTVLPSIYDDSLSYYELLCKLVKMLNTMAEEYGNAIQELSEQYVLLHDYVRDYFTNLDVQEEINNKLDAMAEAGTLIPGMVVTDDESVMTNTKCVYYYTGETTSNHVHGGWYYYADGNWEFFIPANASGTYSTVEEMKTKSLREGDRCRTLGRWNERDGGGREYVITSSNQCYVVTGSTFAALNLFERENPLAIMLDNGNFAIPIINDHVTAFDIGLKRGGVVSYVDAYGKTRIRENSWIDDTSIPAQNSSLLQRYLNRTPFYGIDTSTIPTQGSEFDWSKLKAAYNVVYFPVGMWYFRDAVVVRTGITFEGEYNMCRPKYGSITTFQTGSVLIYLTKEICVLDEASSALPGYASLKGKQRYTFQSETSPNTFVTSGYPVYSFDGTGTNYWLEYKKALEGGGVQSYNPSVGQQENHYTSVTNYTNNNPRTYAQQSLFYAASDGVVFRNLELQAYDCYEFTFNMPWQYVSTGWLQRGWWSGSSTARQFDDNGGRFHPFFSYKKYRGVSAITCRAAVEDESGKICLVGSRNEVTDARYSRCRTSGASTSGVLVEGCAFSGFSDSAIKLGRVGRVRDCSFTQNNVAVDCVANDVYIDDVYIQQGDCGVVTNNHTTNMYSSFVDTQVYAGITSSIVVLDDTISNNTVYVEGGTEIRKGSKFIHITTLGYLTGKFDVNLDYCAVAAYCAYRNKTNLEINGKISHCGCMFDPVYTRFMKLDTMFHTYSAYQTAAGATNPNDYQVFCLALWSNIDTIKLYPTYWLVDNNGTAITKEQLSENKLRNFEEMLGSSAIAIAFAEQLICHASIMPRYGKGVEQNAGTGRSYSIKQYYDSGYDSVPYYYQNIASPMYAFTCIAAYGGIFDGVVIYGSNNLNMPEQSAISTECSMVANCFYQDFCNLTFKTTQMDIRYWYRAAIQQTKTIGSVTYGKLNVEVFAREGDEGEFHYILSGMVSMTEAGANAPYVKEGGAYATWRGQIARFEFSQVLFTRSHNVFRGYVETDGTNYTPVYVNAVEMPVFRNSKLRYMHTATILASGDHLNLGGVVPDAPAFNGDVIGYYSVVFNRPPNAGDPQPDAYPVHTIRMVKGYGGTATDPSVSSIPTLATFDTVVC